MDGTYTVLSITFTIPQRLYEAFHSPFHPNSLALAAVKELPQLGAI